MAANTDVLDPGPSRKKNLKNARIGQLDPNPQLRVNQGFWIRLFFWPNSLMERLTTNV